MVEYNDELSAETERAYQMAEIIRQRSQTIAALNLRAGDRVVDVGCGPGFFPRLLMDKGFKGQVSGCDFSAQAISLSSSLIPEGQFFQHDIYSPIPEKYDLIICMETLEHLLHPEDGLKNLIQAAPRLILTVPEGRKDSFRGHLNLWTKESFEVFLQKALPDKEVQVREVSNEKNLLALVL